MEDLVKAIHALTESQKRMAETAQALVESQTRMTEAIAELIDQNTILMCADDVHEDQGGSLRDV